MNSIATRALEFITANPDIRQRDLARLLDVGSGELQRVLASPTCSTVSEWGPRGDIRYKVCTDDDYDFGEKL